jgi:hypothetical protein
MDPLGLLVGSHAARVRTWTEILPLMGIVKDLEIDRALAKPLPTNASVTPFETRDNCAVQIQAADGI